LSSDFIAILPTLNPGLHPNASFFPVLLLPSAARDRTPLFNPKHVVTFLVITRMSKTDILFFFFLSTDYPSFATHTPNNPFAFCVRRWRPPRTELLLSGVELPATKARLRTASTFCFSFDPPQFVFDSYQVLTIRLGFSPFPSVR